MRFRNDPDGTRLPIKLDPTTNGEFAPVPLSPVHHHARKLAIDAASKHARRLGLTRRAFLVSACGAGAVAQPASASITAVSATMRLIEPPSRNRVAFSLL